MKMLNRSAVRLRARPAFIHWCLGVAGDNQQERDDIQTQLEQTGSVYLVPELESEQDLVQVVNDSAGKMLANELSAWCADSSLWPKTLDGECLRQWFDVDVELMCFDLSPEPLLVADPEALEFL